MQKTTLIIVNSKDRQNGTSSQFRYNLNRYPISDVQQVRVNKINIPYTFYNTIQQTFEVTVNAGIPDIIVIPGGTYNATQLAAQMASSLNSGAPSTTWTVTYNAITNAFTISAAGADTFIFDINNSGIPFRQSVLVQMGMIASSSSSGVTASANSITSLFAPILTRTDNLFVESQQLNLYKNSIFNNDDFNVVQMIPVNTDFGNYIIWQNTAINAWFDQNGKQLQYLDFALVDDYNNLINLRGSDWTIELEFRHSN